MNFYQNPTYPQMDQTPPTPSSTIGYPGYQTPQFQQPIQQPFYQPQPQPGFQPFPPGVQLPTEQSYIENILRLNKGKIASIYMNFENSQWGSKIFKGVIEAAGRDHIVLSDPVTQMRYVLLTIFLNYITFDEEINYEYPYAVPNYPGMMQGNIPTPGYTDGTAPPAYNIPNIQPTTQFRKKDSKKDEK